MKDNLKIFIDGASQPNPGTGGVGIFIANKEIEERISLPLEGTVTNNIAEYQALIICLETIIKKELTYTTIEIFSDSQLICMQFNNKWKCKEKNLALLLIKAQGLKKEIKSAITVNYIPRELNTIADKLAKDAIS